MAKSDHRLNIAFILNKESLEVETRPQPRIDPIKMAARHFMHEYLPPLGTKEVSLDSPSPSLFGLRHFGGRQRTVVDEGPEWACAWCGIKTTPEKRAGPRGNRTLCNRCGLKWARTTKQTRDENRQNSGGGEQFFGEIIIFVGTNGSNQQHLKFERVRW